MKRTASESVDQTNSFWLCSGAPIETPHFALLQTIAEEDANFGKGTICLCPTKCQNVLIHRPVRDLHTKQAVILFLSGVFPIPYDLFNVDLDIVLIKQTLDYFLGSKDLMHRFVLFYTNLARTTTNAFVAAQLFSIDESLDFVAMKQQVVPQQPPLIERILWLRFVFFGLKQPTFCSFKRTLGLADAAAILNVPASALTEAH